jgi:hypothetical protein
MLKLKEFGDYYNPTSPTPYSAKGSSRYRTGPKCGGVKCVSQYRDAQLTTFSGQGIEVSPPVPAPGTAPEHFMLQTDSVCRASAGWIIADSFEQDNANRTTITYIFFINKIFVKLQNNGKKNTHDKQRHLENTDRNL